MGIFHDFWLVYLSPRTYSLTQTRVVKHGINTLSQAGYTASDICHLLLLLLETIVSKCLTSNYTAVCGESQEEIDADSDPRCNQEGSPSPQAGDTTGVVTRGPSEFLTARSTLAREKATHTSPTPGCHATAQPHPSMGPVN